MAHVFYSYIVKQSILSQPVWSACEKRTSVIFTLSFLSLPPSSSWGDCNGLQPRCIQFFFFLFPPELLQFLTCALTCWLRRFLGLNKSDCERFPSSVSEGRPLTFHAHADVCQRARGHARPRMTATTGVLRRHVARYFMNNCQRDEFFPHVCGSKNSCYYCHWG